MAVDTVLFQDTDSSDHKGGGEKWKAKHKNALTRPAVA
jgi:hypothetical protein